MISLTCWSMSASLSASCFSSRAALWCLLDTQLQPEKRLRRMIKPTTPFFAALLDSSVKASHASNQFMFLPLSFPREFLTMYSIYNDSEIHILLSFLIIAYLYNIVNSYINTLRHEKQKRPNAHRGAFVMQNIYLKTLKTLVKRIKFAVCRRV